MEMNSIRFIPIMIQERKENRLKYFLVQAAGSVVFLAGSLSETFLPLVPLAFLLKIGAAPLHMWLISISRAMSWRIIGILVTLQKIAPLAGLILTQFSSSWFIILRALLGGLGGITQSNLRLIVAFSSIRHLSWVIANIGGFASVASYFSLYCLILALAVAPLAGFGLFAVAQIRNSIPILAKVSLSRGLLSLAGLPPFIGFFIKWITIELNFIPPLMVAALVLSSSLSVYFYFKIIIVPLMFPSGQHNPTSRDILLTLSVFLNLLAPLFLL